MADNALDTLTLVLSLERTGMPRPQAEAIARAAGAAISETTRRPQEITDALVGAGFSAAEAEALAHLLSKPELPKAGAIVDTVSRSCRIEAAGLDPAQARIILSFLYEREPARRLSAIFSTAHTARGLVIAGIPVQHAIVLAGTLYRLKSRSSNLIPHVYVIFEALEAAGFDPDDARGFALILRALAIWRAA